jgi:hypothetical protein
MWERDLLTWMAAHRRQFLTDVFLVTDAVGTAGAVAIIASIFSFSLQS